MTARRGLGGNWLIKPVKPSCLLILQRLLWVKSLLNY